MRLLRPAAFASLLFFTAPLIAMAQAAWPTKPVKVIVGYTPGGAVDLIARTLAKPLSESMNQAFVVDNKPGAGTNLANRALIDAPADGYTLMLAANALAANASLYKPAPYDLAKDVMPIALIGRVPVVLAVNAQTGATSIAHWLTQAKAKPEAMNYGSPGNGSTPHLAIELFARAAGISLAHVPYKGGSQAITDTLSGQLQTVAVNALEVQPHVRAGKLRVLAVLSPNRTSIFPDAPTIAESGYAGFEASVWYGLVAPAKTPTEVANKLHAEVQMALQLPEVRERLVAAGGEVLPGPRERLGNLLESERARYEKLIREANIKAE